MATETAAPLVSQNERWKIFLHAFLFASAAFLVLGIAFFLIWRSVLRDKVTLAVINAMHDDE